jgi:hypothetical protein
LFKSLLLSLWTLVLLSLCPDVFISKQNSEFFEITVSHESLELVLLWVKCGREEISVGMVRNVVDEGVAIGVTNGRAEGVKVDVVAEGVAMGLAKGEAIDLSVAEGVPMGLVEGQLLRPWPVPLLRPQPPRPLSRPRPCH